MHNTRFRHLGTPWGFAALSYSPKRIRRPCTGTAGNQKCDLQELLAKPGANAEQGKGFRCWMWSARSQLLHLGYAGLSQLLVSRSKNLSLKDEKRERDQQCVTAEVKQQSCLHLIAQQFGLCSLFSAAGLKIPSVSPKTALAASLQAVLKLLRFVQDN